MRRGAFACLMGVPVEGFRWDYDVVPAPSGLLQGAEREGHPWLVAPAPLNALCEVREYGPLSVAQLHKKFSALKLDEAAILEFANAYGLLGPAPTPLIDPRIKGKGQPVLVGESLQLWKREVYALSTLLELWEKVQEGDAGWLGQRIVWSENPRRVELRLKHPSGGQSGELIAAEGEPGISRRMLTKWRSGRDVIEPARYLVHRKVNTKLAGHVSPAILPSKPGEFTLIPDSLLASLYVHFALEINGRRRPPRLCPVCDKSFTPERSDQRYCSPKCRKNLWYHEHHSKAALERKAAEAHEADA